MPATTAGEALCRGCGLCCDGTLFTQVPLTGDEATRARGLRLPVLSRPDGAQALRQPCLALTSAGCAVYDERPGGCRRYRCMLLVAVVDEEVALPEAQQIVAGAHALLAALATTLPPGPGAPLQRARAAASLEPPAAAALLAARRHLARHLDRSAG